MSGVSRAIAVVFGAALGFVACRPGEGDYCRCPDECRGGLVCAQSGAIIDVCIDAAPGAPAGRCIPADGASQMVDEVDTTAAPDYHDVGGKRDFEPGTPVDESSGADTVATSSASATTDASTSTDGSTSTSTSTSGGSSSSSSGGTSSGSTGP